MDLLGDAYVTGFTESIDFPTTVGALQTTLRGLSDAFVTKLNSTGSALVYSTYLGGSSREVGDGVAVDSSSNTYVTGFTTSSDFPTTAGAPQTTFGGSADAFVSKISFCPQPKIKGENLDQFVTFCQFASCGGGPLRRTLQVAPRGRQPTVSMQCLLMSLRRR